MMCRGATSTIGAARTIVNSATSITVLLHVHFPDRCTMAAYVLDNTTRSPRNYPTPGDATGRAREAASSLS